MVASASGLRRLRGVLFDLDGTLVDTEALHHRSARAVLAAFEAELSWEDYARLIGISEEEFWERLRERFRLRATAAELTRRRTQAYLRLLEREPVPLRPGVPEVLLLLEQHGVPRAVASSSPALQIEATLRAAGLAARLRFWVSGHDHVSRSKPEPHVYLAAASLLGLEAGACLAVEDSVAGVAAARSAGALVVAVPSTHPADPRLAQADLLLDSLASLVPHLRRLLQLT